MIIKKLNGHEWCDIIFIAFVTYNIDQTFLLTLQHFVNISWIQSEINIHMNINIILLLLMQTNVSLQYVESWVEMPGAFER